MHSFLLLRQPIADSHYNDAHPSLLPYPNLRAPRWLIIRQSSLCSCCSLTQSETPQRRPGAQLLSQEQGCCSVHCSPSLVCIPGTGMSLCAQPHISNGGTASAVGTDQLTSTSGVHKVSSHLDQTPRTSVHPILLGSGQQRGISTPNISPPSCRAKPGRISVTFSGVTVEHSMSGQSSRPLGEVREGDRDHGEDVSFSPSCYRG